MTYGQPLPPRIRKLGRPRAITVAAGRTLLRALGDEPDMLIAEMRYSLFEEHGILVDETTIGRFLSRVRWTKKAARRLARRQNTQLRNEYLAEIRLVPAEKLVFLDEATFKQQTGWRLEAWAPIGDEARYSADIERGSTYGVLAAYTVNEGYLKDCISVKAGYYNGDDFFCWLTEGLLPALAERPASVIVLDNVGIHLKERVQEAIEAAGHLIKYLPPYSPDFNPIEMSWRVLKAWMRRNYSILWPNWTSGFGAFLRMAITRSECDRFASKHFKHCAGGSYTTIAEMEEVQRQLRKYITAGGLIECVVSEAAETVLPRV